MKLSRRTDINRVTRWFTSLLIQGEEKVFLLFVAVGEDTKYRQTIIKTWPRVKQLSTGKNSHNNMWKMMFKDHFGCFHVKTINHLKSVWNKAREERKKGSLKHLQWVLCGLCQMGRKREKQQLNGFFADVKYLISRTDFFSRMSSTLMYFSLGWSPLLPHNCQCLRWWNVIKNKCWWGDT